MLKYSLDKYIQSLLIYTIYLLFILCVISIAFSLSNLVLTNNFELSNLGYKNFINSISEYVNIYSSFFAVIVIYIAYDQLKEMSKNNSEQIKTTLFIDWKNSLTQRAEQHRKTNEIMVNEILRQSRNINNIIYSTNFRLANKEQVDEIYLLFSSYIDIFEMESPRYKENGGSYFSKDTEFALDIFRYIVLNSVEGWEKSIGSYFSDKYISMLSTNREILNPEL